MLSGALGIQFTGEAIGKSLKQIADKLFPLSHGWQMPGNILTMATFPLAMYIWWQTFRKTEEPPPGERLKS